MTGEVMVSEDIVQEAFLKWMNRPEETILDDKAYLAKSVINTALNHLEKVKREREAYKGPWLPEPILADSHAIDAKIDISYGFMLLLEKLAPLERAVFILKESFDFGYSELAKLFDTTEANGRQLYHRAKEKVSGTNRRFPIDPQQQQILLEAFAEASETGNIDPLIHLFKTDIEVYSDGGGKVIAALKPLVGSAIVEQFMRSLVRQQYSQLDVKPALVNGEMALLFSQKDSHMLTTVMIIDVDEAGIRRFYFVRNPDKLAHLQ
ncbi:RNA polymerase subunit sigma-70 [Spirosoma sp. HMF4905]|uniref:RNA polymerase subunit sigma-70 n=2 Tax=Spirosoma arboris TaxID=2682092 RepID=A0A7K1SNY4_9BACT|nr:RNA polymerase subunit sigma-70 [Spirosoma arboris]